MSGIKTGSIDSGLEAKTVFGCNSTETVMRYDAKAIHGSISTETVLQGNEKWLIGNHDSAPRLYGTTFSPLEEKFTGLSCDPEEWTLDLPKKSWWQFWAQGTKYHADPEDWALKGLYRIDSEPFAEDKDTLIGVKYSAGVKTFGIKNIIAPDYLCKQKLGGAKEERTKTGSIESEQWI